MSNAGYATLQIIPSMKGTKGRIESALGGGVLGTIGTKSGKSLGGRLVSGLGGILKKGAFAVGAAAGGVLATALVKGWGRLTQIENATAKLGGLGHSAGSVKAIMDNALASVKGTAFGLGDAATVAASTVAAGIKPGKDLERVLKLVGDAATIGGTSMGEMGAIFNKVASSGKVTGRELNQLNMAGIPIVQLLGKSMGKTSDEITKMVSKGQVSFADFSKAIEIGMGGAALKSGETTQGAFANMGAALGRFGAVLLQDIFPLAKVVFGGITSLLDKATGAVGPFAEKFGDLLATKVVPALQGLFDVLVKGDFTKRFREAFNVEEDAPLVDFLFTLREKAAAVFGEIKGGLQAFVLAFIAGGNDITSAGFAGKLEEFGLVLRRVFDNLKESAIVLWPAIKEIGTSLATASQQIGVSVWDAFLIVLEGASQVVLALAPTIASLSQWMSQNQAVVTGLVAAWTAFRLGMLAWRGVTAVLAAYKAVTLSVAAAQQAFAFGTYGVAAAQTTLSGKLAFATGRIWAQITASMAWARQTAVALAMNLRWQLLLLQQSARTAAGVIAGWVRMGAAAVAQGARMAASAALTAARVVAGWVLMGVQSLLQAARMAAAWVIAMGPIGWVTAAVIAIVVLIIKNWDTVKRVTLQVWQAVSDFVKRVWEGIKNLASNVWSFIVRVVTGYINAYRTVIVTVFNAVRSVITTVLNAVKSFITGVWDGIRNTVTGLVGRIRDGISNAWNAVRDRTTAAFNRVRDAISGTIGRVVDTVRSLPGKVVSAIGNLGSTLYNKGRDLVQGLINGVTSLAGKIGKFFLDKVPGWIRGPFEKALGIHSPSTVFAAYGENIGEGALVGISRMRPDLDTAMRSLVTVPPLPAIPPGSLDMAPAAARAAAAGAAANRVALDDQTIWKLADAMAQLSIGLDGDVVGSFAADATWGETKARG